MPIRTVDNHHFPDYMNPVEAPVTKTQLLIGELNGVRRKSPEMDIVGKTDSPFRRGFGKFGTGGFFLGEAVFLFLIKVNLIDAAPGQESLYGDTGGNRDTVHYRGSYR